MARAKPASLVASEHFLAISLRSELREQLSLDVAGSKPKDLERLGKDLSCGCLLALSLQGCIRVAAA